MIAQIKGAQARVAEARGNHEEALDLYRRVIDVGVPLEQRFWTTLARIGAARCLVALDRDQEASSELDRARADAEYMGAARLLDEIESVDDSGREALQGG